MFEVMCLCVCVCKSFDDNKLPVFYRNHKKWRFCRKNLQIRALRKLWGILLRSTKASQTLPPCIYVNSWKKLLTKNLLSKNCKLYFWGIATALLFAPTDPNSIQNWETRCWKCIYKLIKKFTTKNWLTKNCIFLLQLLFYICTSRSKFDP